MIKWIKRIWNNLFSQPVQKRYSKILRVNEQPRYPISSNSLVLVMGGSTPKWLKFICPCGCGVEHNLPLSKNHEPHWTVKNENDKTISVFPSVDIPQPSCGAHFWIKHNSIVWAGQYPRSKK